VESTGYSCQILMQLEFTQQIFEKSDLFHSDRQTDRQA